MIDECKDAQTITKIQFQPAAGMSNATIVVTAIINPGTIPIVTTQLTSTTCKYLYKGGIMRPGMGAQVNSIVHFMASRQDTDVIQNLKCYNLWMKLSDALNLNKLCPIYGAHNTINTRDKNWLESKILVTIFATNNKRNEKIVIHQKCCNLIKIELVLTRDFYATTKLNPEHVEIGVTNAIHIGSGVFTESLIRWMDRDFPRSPFTVLDMSLPNEELKSTIA